MSFWNELPKPFTALAPMAGVTDTIFRQLCKSHGADVVYTEFVSVDAIAYESKKTFEMMHFQPEEKPVVVQIFGKDPAKYKNAARVIADMGFSGIDINFGCPAYKVVKNGGGVSLMRNPKFCAELVAAAIDGAGSVPVSIKCRASINKKADVREVDYKKNEDDGLNYCDESCSTDKNTVSAVDLLREMQCLNLGAVMLHARSYENPFDGKPNLTIYEEVRNVYKGILIANGGITSPELAREVMDHGFVDGVGIARGAWGNPWLFQQVKDYLTTGAYKRIELEEIKNTIRLHAKLALQFGGSFGIIEMRKHLGWYTKGFPNASELRKQFVACKTIEDIEIVLNNWK